ncbi:MAG: SDR family NAD(P)-dependent oxidoreductase [Candidatus Hodarchaeota archaeon]
MSDPKVILITGTRKGIGRFLAEYYVGKGFLVEGCSRKPPDWDLKNYHHHITDVTNESQVKEMFSSIRERHKRLDVTINNAGIASMNHVLLMPGATATKIIQTNLYGTFLICRESAKLMMKQRYGRIVNFSTIAVPMQLEGEAVYAASKSAAVTFTKILARELAGYGITCNAVGPAPIETDLIRGIPSEKMDQVVNRLAIKSLGSFNDVANVIDFFVRPESAAVTGQVLYLGGV